MDRFDKGDEYISFWDEVFGDDGLSSEDIEEIQKYYSQRPQETPVPITIIGDFDEDLPF